MFKTFLKLIVSIGLITLLLFNVEWRSILPSLKSIDTVTILIAFAIFTIQFPISAWKWKLSLKVHELDYSFLFLQKVLCIGFFFNNFLPTSIGGDAYRIYKTMPSDGYKSRSVSAVLYERIVGFSALILLGFIGGIIYSFEESNVYVHAFLVFCLVGGSTMMVILWLAYVGFFSTLVDKIRKIEKLDFVVHNLSKIWKNPLLNGKIILISIFFQILAILAIAILFDALSVDAGYEKYALIAATVGLATFLPISINGIGVIEGAFVVSSMQLGIGYNEAVIVAFLLRILVFPLSLICGFIYLLDNTSTNKALSNRDVW